MVNLLIGWWIAAGGAREPLPGAASDSLITAADYLDYERVSDPQISPDDGRPAITESSAAARS